MNAGGAQLSGRPFEAVVVSGPAQPADAPAAAGASYRSIGDALRAAAASGSYASFITLEEGDHHIDGGAIDLSGRELVLRAAPNARAALRGQLRVAGGRGRLTLRDLFVAGSVSLEGKASAWSLERCEVEREEGLERPSALSVAPGADGSRLVLSRCRVRGGGVELRAGALRLDSCEISFAAAAVDAGGSLGLCTPVLELSACRLHGCATGIRVVAPLEGRAAGCFLYDLGTPIEAGDPRFSLVACSISNAPPPLPPLAIGPHAAAPPGGRRPSGPVLAVPDPCESLAPGATPPPPHALHVPPAAPSPRPSGLPPCPPAALPHFDIRLSPPSLGAVPAPQQQQSPRPPRASPPLWISAPAAFLGRLLGGSPPPSPDPDDPPPLAPLPPPAAAPPLRQHVLLVHSAPAAGRARDVADRLAALGFSVDWDPPSAPGEPRDAPERVDAAVCAAGRQVLAVAGPAVSSLQCEAGLRLEWDPASAPAAAAHLAAAIARACEEAAAVSDDAEKLLPGGDAPRAEAVVRWARGAGGVQESLRAEGVERRLDELAALVRGMAQADAGTREQLKRQADALAALTAQQRRLLEQQAEHRRMLLRSMIATLNVDQCRVPSLYILVPFSKQDRKWWKPGDWVSDKVRLHLLCECPGEAHLTEHEGYPISRPKEFFRRAGPYLATALKLLSIAAGAAVGLSVPDEVIAFASSMGLDPLKDRGLDVRGIAGRLGAKDPAAALREAAQAVEAFSSGLPSRVVDCREEMRGALEALLGSVDDRRELGGLRKTLTASGEVHWMCRPHASEWAGALREPAPPAHAPAPRPAAGSGDGEPEGYLETAGSALTRSLQRLF
eukprot:tig00000630_g2735.t1